MAGKVPDSWKELVAQDKHMGTDLTHHTMPPQGEPWQLPWEGSAETSLNWVPSALKGRISF